MNNKIILSNEESQLILGALDSLGVALAKHGHQWTEGEREIYEQSTSLCVASTSLCVASVEILKRTTKYILYKDSVGFAKYNPEDGSISHTLDCLNADEATMPDWSEVLAFGLGDYHFLVR